MKVHRIDHGGNYHVANPGRRDEYRTVKISLANRRNEIHIYENTYKLCYIRGPEGIILELAEQLEQ